MSRSHDPAVAETAAVWALPRSLATTGGITCCFLLLRVMRCFSSPRLPPLQDDWNLSSRVAPFGNPRVKGYLHLVVDYRGLSRPSSPPRAKASTARPSLFTFVSVVCLYLPLSMYHYINGSVYLFTTFLLRGSNDPLTFQHVKELLSSAKLKIEN